MVKKSSSMGLSEVHASSETEFGVKDHSKLLKNVAKVYGKKAQRIRPPVRLEVASEPTEFHVACAKKKAKNLKVQLADSLEIVGKHSNIAHKVKKVFTAPPLPAPLQRPVAEKIKRIAAYDNTKITLEKWDPVVTANKVTELQFPLNTPYFKMQTTTNFHANFKPVSKLEKEVESILSGLDGDDKDKENRSKPEPKKTFFLNRKEILQQRRELARIRAQQSYREAKARRQNKIKSKKYHRILRREKTKQQIKEFENLQKTDPEAALKKLEELERTRAEERVSLRHRSTGQWAKNKAVHAKYDKESRQQLHQQLRISKELTTKVNKDASSEDEDMVEHEPVSVDNPWMKENDGYEEFSSKYRKYWEEQCAKENEIKQNNASTSTVEIKERGSSNENGNIRDQPSVMVFNPNLEITRYGFLTTDIDDKSFKMRSKGTFSSGWECSSIKVSSNPKKGKNQKDKQPKIMKDVDDLFEEMEDKLKKKFEKKVSQLKKNVLLSKDAKPKTDVKSKKDMKSNKSSHVNRGVQTDGTNKKKHNDGKKTEAVKESVRHGKETTQQLINDETTRRENRRDNTPGTSSNGIDGVKTLTSIAPRKVADPSEIDPTSFIQIHEKVLNTTQIPDLVDNEEDNTIATENEKLMTISEAFTDDDVVAEFRQEKQVIADKDKPKDIDLTLPGWGQWAGTGISPTPRRSRKYKITAPKNIPRKDDKKESVIINENADSSARAHQVNELPHPYVAVETFESAIRAPLGCNWVPETAHRKFIAPRVSTLLGTVIEPLTAEALFDDSKDKEDEDDEKNIFEID